MDGETPVYVAARKGHLDVVKELVRAGANKEAAKVRLPSPLAPTAADALARLAAAGEALEARQSWWRELSAGLLVSQRTGA